MPQVIIDSDEEIVDEPEPEPKPEPLPQVPEPEPLPQVPEPEPEEKVKIQLENVFKKSEISDVVPVIKKPKRTRTMSALALEKLAIARAKGLETRRKNKLLREQGKMATPTQKKAQVKADEVEAKRPVINNVVHKTENITNTITHDDIMKISKKATQDAMDEYENKRLERKALKKKKYEKENHATIVKNKINSALGMQSTNPFDICF